MSEVLLNRRDEGRHAFECAPTNAVARDLAEPPFDEVEPRTAGWNEMKVDARMTTQPPLDGRALVRAQVIQDHMNGVVRRRPPLDAVEKADKFLRVALGTARPEDGPIEQPQGGIQAGGTVPDVIMGLAFRDPWAQRQHGARSVQRLDAAFFVDAEDDSLLRRLEVQAHDVAELVDKVRIFRQFESRD